MTAAERYGLPALVLALLLAVTVRAPSVIYGDPAGRDIAEFASISRNLQQGRGFQLDIKAYHAFETPVVHYSGYDRAPLFPFILNLFETALGETGRRVVSPFFFVLALALIFDLIRKVASVSIAFWVTALLGLHPGLLKLTVLPLSEPLLLFWLVFAVWASTRFRNPWVAGSAAALCFLTRPASVLPLAVISLAHLSSPQGGRSLRGWACFVLMAVTGPLLLLWLNMLNGAPALLLPQSFLLRVLDHTDFVHTMNAGRVYDSPGALLSAEGMQVARQIAKHGLYYLQALADSMHGLGAILLLAPLSVWGFVKRGWLRPLLWLLAVAGIDLLFYTLMWSTFDAMRFTSIFNLIAVAVLVAGACFVLEEVQLIRRKDDVWPASAAMGFALALLWGSASAFSGYLTWSESAGRGPHRDAIIDLWNRPDSIQTGVWISRNPEALDVAPPSELNQRPIATNVPWLMNTLTHHPCVLLPYDLNPDELVAFLQNYKAGYVVIHAGDWPEAHAEALQTLRVFLSVVEAELLFETGDVEIWKLPTVLSLP